jgi:ribonuclease HI
MKIWCDGGNNKIGEYCVITEIGNKYTHQEKRRTNNEMEYKAMMKALELAADGDMIYSDSQLVINQLLGFWQVNKPLLKGLYYQCRKILKTKNVKIKWIPRRRNVAGKILATRVRKSYQSSNI